MFDLSNKGNSKKSGKRSVKEFAMMEMSIGSQDVRVEGFIRTSDICI